MKIQLIFLGQVEYCPSHWLELDREAGYHVCQSTLIAYFQFISLIFREQSRRLSQLHKLRSLARNQLILFSHLCPSELHKVQ